MTTKPRLRRVLTLVALFMIWAHPVMADVRLPAVVSDGMVLQRDVKLRIWGWADPSEQVRVEFNGGQFETTADTQGNWSVELGPYSAGGPFEMILTGRNTLRLRDILIGDVWLASGQSNMEMPLKGSSEWTGGILNAEQEIASAHHPRIRLFKVKRTVAATLQDDVETSGWKPVTPEAADNFSAVAYLFGRELHRHLDVPIGLIQSAWGGTVAEAWMSEQGLRPFPKLHAQAAKLHEALAGRDANERFKASRKAWMESHSREDRGTHGELAAWADPALDDTDWKSVSVPRKPEAFGKDIKGFGGVVWFRRTLEIPADLAGQPLTLRLHRLVQDDTTWFNGTLVGTTKGYEDHREYVVPADKVRAGANLIAIRLSGYDTPDQGYTGFMFGDEPVAEIGGKTIPLSGTWSWQPGPDLADFPVPDATVELGRRVPNVSALLYNGMIHPLTPFRIKGVIWYQGESNAGEGRATEYRTLFPGLIRDWRRLWGDEFPFLFVQLAGFGSNDVKPTGETWADFREAQTAALALPRTAMATAIDVGDEKDIHPKNKQAVAYRLYLAALRTAYDEDVVASGPIYVSMEREGAAIRLKFTQTSSGLLARDGQEIRGFEIAGAGGGFLPAQAKLDKNEILVSAASVPQPEFVRYNWRNTPDGNVYNREGLPLLPFRTTSPR